MCGWSFSRKKYQTDASGGTTFGWSFVDALLAALARWSGRERPGAFDDDLTLVVLDV